MAENLYRRATKEEREAAWAESRLFYEIEEATDREAASLTYAKFAYIF